MSDHEGPFDPHAAERRKSPYGPDVRAPAHLTNYGSGVRAQVFEVIVRQAMAGAPWEEICAGPMAVNYISANEVREEVRRRRGGSGGPPTAAVPRKPIQPSGASSITLSLPEPDASNEPGDPSEEQ